MAVPFGFSVGDFISGVNLIIVSVKAVQGRKGASAEYEELGAELESLKAGLSAIDDLKLRETAQKEQAAIEQATYRCQRCIEAFIKSIATYQRWLKPESRGFRANLHKIQWAMCKRDDINRLRTQLERHSSSINMLLITLQVKKYQEMSRLQGNCQQIALATQGTMEGLRLGQETGNEMTKDLSSRQDRLLDELLKEACELRAMVQQHQQIPPQVLLQKPVVLLDACGKLASFHLDFITSAEAFMAVLKIRFRQNGVTANGLRKLDKSEFILRDHQGELSLRRPWETVFAPGQKVDMSMIFYRPVSVDKCPSCGCVNESTPSDEVECTHCGMLYRQVLDENRPTRHSLQKSASSLSPHGLHLIEEALERASPSPSGDELKDFRRVQVHTTNCPDPMKPITPVSVLQSKTSRAVHSGPTAKATLTNLPIPLLMSSSRRPTYKISDQGRRNRINVALKEMTVLLTNGPAMTASEQGLAAVGNNMPVVSKATTIEMAIMYIKSLQEELLDVKSKLGSAMSKPP